MKIVILTNILEKGISPFAASARIRGAWVAKYLKKACPTWDVHLNDLEHAKTADLVIFQKCYQNHKVLDLAMSLCVHKSPTKMIFDLCDADWLDEAKRKALLYMLPCVDAAVGSHPMITAWLSQWVEKCYTITDGIDLEGLPAPKKHIPTTPNQPRLVWFGNRSNYHLIEGKRKAADKAGTSLVTISDHPDANFKWQLATIARDIQMADIFWDPRGYGIAQECKTNNKELFAWALGLPVIHEKTLGEEFSRFLSPEARKKEGALRIAQVKEYHDMGVIIKQWLTVIEVTLGGKNV